MPAVVARRRRRTTQIRLRAGGGSCAEAVAQLLLDGVDLGVVRGLREALVDGEAQVEVGDVGVRQVGGERQVERHGRAASSAGGGGVSPRCSALSRSTASASSRT